MRFLSPYNFSKLAEKGKTSSFSSFKDASLGNSRTIVDLIDAISPGYINYDLVTAASTDDVSINVRFSVFTCKFYDNVLMYVGCRFVKICPVFCPIMTFVLIPADVS